MTDNNTNGKKFPNANELTSPERVAHINALQAKHIAGVELSTDELRFGVSLMQTERKHKATTAGAKKTAKSPPVKPLTLSDF